MNEQHRTGHDRPAPGSDPPGATTTTLTSTPPAGGNGRLAPPLLQVEDLDVRFAGRRRLLGPRPAPIRAVNGVSFEIAPGTTFGLVGESGSGKSTVARAILNLVQPTGGRIRLDGVDTIDLTGDDLLRFRRRVQAVLQDPFSSLNQVHDVSVIVGDAITRHRGVARGSARDELVVGLLDLVGLPPEMVGRHPYEMSGGQRQRVSIARALAVEPELIIADEPTSALDVSIQSQVINLLGQIQRRSGVTFLVIAHDLEVVRHMSHDVGVLYLGRLVEVGPVDAVYQQPTHPYTEMLIASIPVPDPVAQAERRRLRRHLAIDAEPPSPAGLGPGCPFASRCPAAFEPCIQVMPDPVPAHHGGVTRCHLHTDGPVLGGGSVLDHLRSVTAVRLSPPPPGTPSGSPPPGTLPPGTDLPSGETVS